MLVGTNREASPAVHPGLATGYGSLVSSRSRIGHPGPKEEHFEEGLLVRHGSARGPTSRSPLPNREVASLWFVWYRWWLNRLLQITAQGPMLP
jgi:hypothetical protein